MQSQTSLASDDLLWVNLLGGQRLAVMWLADFAGFISMQLLKLDLFHDVRYRVQDGMLEIADAVEVFRIFPSIVSKKDDMKSSEFPFETIHIKDCEEALESYFLVDSNRSSGFAYDTCREAFSASFINYLNTLRERGSNARVFRKSISVRQFLRVLDEQWSLVAPDFDPAETRYFVALSICRRCRAVNDSHSARIIQRCINSFEPFRQSKLERPVYDHLKLIKDHSICPYDSTTDINELQVGDRSGLYLLYLVLLGRYRQKPARKQEQLTEEEEEQEQELTELVSHPRPSYMFSTECLDSEYVLSRLFGLPATLTGVDELFGGGGLFLYNSLDGQSKRDVNSSSIPGKIVLVRGGFGSGKTSFGLSFAASIARLGGLSVFFAMEFDEQHILYNMERLGIETVGSHFRIFRSIKECRKHFQARDYPKDAGFPGSQLGAILLVTVKPDERSALKNKNLFKWIKLISDWSVPVFPRVVIVDSLNAVSRERLANQIPRKSQEIVSKIPLVEEVQNPTQVSSSIQGELHPVDDSGHNYRDEVGIHNPEVRRFVLYNLRNATNVGTNLVLLSEEDDKSWTQFGEDISDTVIRLYGPNESPFAFRFEKYGVTPRLVQVSKSRFQKEHPGFHFLEIIPGEGVKVTLSSEANASIISSRRETYLPEDNFGVDSIDSLLLAEKTHEGTSQSGNVRRGNCGRVVLLEGEMGTSKTQMGLHFLQAAANEKASGYGLVISLRYQMTDIVAKAREKVTGINVEQKNRRISTCYIKSGNVLPGYIFEQIKLTLDDAKRANRPFQRVLLDNPGEWEDLCPLLESDPLWAVTLIRLLRTYGVRILVTNRLIAAKESRLLRAILEQVDTYIVLGRRMLAGSRVSTLQVNRSPSMRHDTRLHVMSGDNFGLTPIDLMRYNGQGRVLPLNVRVLRRRQTHLTEKYWENVKSLILTAMPSKVSIEETGSFGHRFGFELAAGNQYDSLNIIEIDEYELANAFHVLAELKISSEHLAGFSGRFTRKLNKIKVGLSKKVVPFFDNSSCLLFDKGRLNDDQSKTLVGNTITWRDLASISKDWGLDNGTFFSFPANEPENWNCLFLEIAASCGLKFDEHRCIHDLILASNAVTNAAVVEASIIFHNLLHGLHRSKHRNGDLYSKFDVSDDAVVSRHWYTTLIQTLETLKGKSCDLSSYVIRRLPDNFSVSGEWYLGILAGSANINGGQELLKYITTPKADIDRFRLRVGLPVRNMGYGGPRTTDGPAFSTNCYDNEFFLNDQQNSIRYIDRSMIENYHEFNHDLSLTLQRIVGEPDIANFEARIDRIWREFLARWPKSSS